MTLKEFCERYTGYFPWVTKTIAEEVIAYLSRISEKYYGEIFGELVYEYPPKATPGVYEIRRAYADVREPVERPKDYVPEITPEQREQNCKMLREFINNLELKEKVKNEEGH